MTPRVSTRLLILALVLFLAAPVLARRSDPPAGEKSQLPFGPNEELVYEGEFTRLMFRGIDIADLTFRTTYLTESEKPSGPVTSVRFSAEAQSKGIVVKLFGIKFRQQVDSTVDLEPFGVRLTSKTDEQGKRVRTSKAVFDQAEGKVTYTEQDPNQPNQTPRVVESPVLGAAQDIASVFYFLRTQKLENGTTLTVQVSDSGQVYPVNVKVTGRKKIKTVLGKIWVVQVEPDLFGEGKLLRSKGSLIIWMSDDRRHVPVEAQIKMDLGTVDIKLKRATLTNAT